MPTIPHPQFYVYVLARPNGKPFYVGKGKGRRVYDHEKEARNGHKCHKCNVIRKIWRQGGEIQRYIVFTTHDEQEAFAYEQERIKLHGRENLTNLTDGGEGSSGYQKSVETRRKLSLAGKGRPAPNKGISPSLEVRRKISAALKGRPLAPQVREQFIKINIGRQYSEVRRNKISLAQTGGRLHTIIAPDGTTHEHIMNLRAFAKEHGLGASFERAIRGKRKQYRGWRGWIEGTEPPPPLRAFTIIAPNGTRYEHITNPNAFAREYGLNAHQLRAMLRGKFIQSHGWTGFREEPRS